MIRPYKRRRTAYVQAVRRMGEYGGAYSAGQALARAVRGRYRNAGQTMFGRRRMRTGQGVTDQFDRKVIYRKRFMPKRKRRRWKAFKSKVNYCSEKDLGSKTVVFNNRIEIGSTGSQTNIQGVGECALYSMRGVKSHMKDIYTITSTDADIPATGKACFQSAVLDITLVNNSQSSDGSVTIPVEIDIYEIVASKSFRSLAADGDLEAVFTDAATNTVNINGAATGLTQTQRGVTPWDFPQALGQYGLKILKKTKFQLSFKQVLTYQIRDPRRHVFDKTSVEDWTATANGPKVTRFLYFVARSVPGFGDTATDKLSVYAGITRKYLYKVNESTQDFDANY